MSESKQSSSLLLQQEYNQDGKKPWELLWEQAQQRHNGKLQIRAKYEWKKFWTFVSWLLQFVTLGKGLNILEEYYTTLGRTIWTPGDGSQWTNTADDEKFELLSHEIDHLDWIYLRCHSAQDYPDGLYQEVNWFSRWWHSVKYLFWPFPYRYAYYRQQVEYWGYQRNLICSIIRAKGAISQRKIEWIKTQFTGSAYAWMATPQRAEQLMQQMIAESLVRCDLTAIKMAFQEKFLQQRLAAKPNNELNLAEEKKEEDQNQQERMALDAMMAELHKRNIAEPPVIHAPGKVTIIEEPKKN